MTYFKLLEKIKSFDFYSSTHEGYEYNYDKFVCRPAFEGHWPSRWPLKALLSVQWSPQMKTECFN